MNTDIERYLREYSSAEEPLLTELDRVTNQRIVQARMISGQVQGRFLEMTVRMMQPRRVLEIGTFTGYSALSMAAGLTDEAELHTIEIDDELQPLAQSFFDRSPYGQRIKLHIGSALDIVPLLGVFDLIFIDGDKRQYPDYYRMLMNGSVHSGTVMLADNVLWYGKVVEAPKHGDVQTAAIEEFNAMVCADERVENVILPLRDGINMIRVL